MHVQNRLTCCRSTVHTNIVSIRLITFFKPLLALLNQLHDGLLFSSGEVKPVSRMAIRDN